MSGVKKDAYDAAVTFVKKKRCRKQLPSGAEDPNGKYHMKVKTKSKQLRLCSQKNYQRYYVHHFRNIHDRVGLRSIILNSPDGRRWEGKIPYNHCVDYSGDVIKIRAKRDGTPSGQWAEYFTELEREHHELSPEHAPSNAERASPVLL